MNFDRLFYNKFLAEFARVALCLCVCACFLRSSRIPYSKLIIRGEARTAKLLSFFFANLCRGYATSFLGMTLDPCVSAGAPGKLKLRVV